MTLSVCAISDLHGVLPETLPEADVLVIAGDIAPDDPGSLFRTGTTQQAWWETTAMSWIHEQAHTEVIVVPGNHDFYFPGQWNTPVSVHFVSSPRVIEIEGFLIYCTPYCLSLPGWAYQAPEAHLWDYYRHMPIGVDMVVSHGPAHGYLDKTAHTHAGSRALKAAIRRARPSVVVSGHIHEDAGKHKQMDHPGTPHKTHFYNVSQRNAQHAVTHNPRVIQLERRLGFAE